MAVYRATIKPIKRIKGGKVIWIARGTIPVRSRDGSVQRQRYEEGITALRGPRERIEYCNRLCRSFEDRVLLAQKPMTFDEALKVYVEIGHEPPRFEKQLRAEMGDVMCSDIDDALLGRVRKKIFKKTAAAAHVNRNLHTPVIAVLRLAAKNKACSMPLLTRPVGHKDIKPVEIPASDEWYGKVAAHMSPAILAFFLAQSVHGRRTREWLRRTPADFDPDAGTLFLGKTKNGQTLQLDLHPRVVLAIKRIPDWQNNAWLFRCTPSSPSRVRMAIKRACVAAGVAYFTPHKFGRHAAVSRALMAGRSTKWVADMYGMTEEMVVKRYGHLAKSETTRSVHEMGDVLLDAVGGDAMGTKNPQLLDEQKKPSNLLINNSSKEGINGQ